MNAAKIFPTILIALDVGAMFFLALYLCVHLLCNNNGMRE